MPTNNLAFAVLERAALQPDAAAFVMPGRVITYERAASLIVNFARRMQDFGVSRESTVALEAKGLPTATIAALAVALLGSRWVSAMTFADGVTHTFSAEQDMFSLDTISIDRSWYDAPPLPLGDLQFPGHSDPGDVWMIAESSGTTGTRKLMPITYETVWRRVLISESQDGTPPITWNLFPPLSAHGARVNAGNLVAGGTNVSPAPWGELLRLGVNRVTGSPSQVLSTLERKTEDRRIRSVKVAGGHVTRQFIETALRHAEEIHLAYGATEVGAVARASVTHIDQFDGSVGLPNDGAQFEIVDEADQPAARGNEGVVRVKTGWMVTGYLNEPALTASIFRNGWFHPGDLGFIDAGGSLHITGRTNEVINVGGVKLNAAAIDEVVQQHHAVSDGYCFVRTDGTNGATVLCAIVALRPDADPDSLEQLRKMAGSKFGRPGIPRLAYIVDEVPRNANGKPLRATAAQLALQLTPMALSNTSSSRGPRSPDLPQGQPGEVSPPDGGTPRSPTA